MPTARTSCVIPAVRRGRAVLDGAFSWNESLSLGGDMIPKLCHHGRFEHNDRASEFDLLFGIESIPSLSKTSFTRLDSPKYAAAWRHAFYIFCLRHRLTRLTAPPTSWEIPPPHYYFYGHSKLLVTNTPPDRHGSYVSMGVQTDLSTFARYAPLSLILLSHQNTSIRRRAAR